jgi:hypothetical protein
MYCTEQMLRNCDIRMLVVVVASSNLAFMF